MINSCEPVGWLQNLCHLPWPPWPRPAGPHRLRVGTASALSFPLLGFHSYLGVSPSQPVLVKLPHSFSCLLSLRGKIQGPTILFTSASSLIHLHLLLPHPLEYAWQMESTPEIFEEGTREGLWEVLGAKRQG